MHDAHLTFWVIVPEQGTDEIVRALRNSWLRGLRAADVMYCVANGSDGRDAALHWLPFSRPEGTPTSREQFNLKGEVFDIWAKEAYNGFLRRKVFMMLQEMARRAALRPPQLDYAFLLDADTAVNVSNLRRFLGALPPGGVARVYTGRCLQDGLAAPPSPTRRKEIARFIRLSERYRRAGRVLAWNERLPPSPGGGPGILLSRALLTHLRPGLEACASLALPFAMGRGSYAGGDSMLTRCFAMLGVRCSTELDLGLEASPGTPSRCPFAHGCSLTALFRKNPPWLYYAVERHIGGRRAVRAVVEQFDGLGLDTPLHDVISFHHVRPTTHDAAMRADPRCAIRLHTDKTSHARWWSSSCIPHFCLVGAPHANSTALLDALLAHPDVVRPSRRSFAFFHRPHVIAAARGKPSVAIPRLVSAYSELFPQVDPRDFRLTGEASAGYMYSHLAATFFSSTHLRLARLVILLRDPVSRTLRALERHPEQAVEASFRAFERCGAARLYAACPQGVEFAERPARQLPPRAGCVPSDSQMELAVSPPAVWQSWYHLFVPRWIKVARSRLLLLFYEEVSRQPTRSVVSRLYRFMRLPTDDHLLARIDSPLCFQTATRHDFANATVRRLRSLMELSVSTLNEQLKAAHEQQDDEWLPRRVPAEWMQPL
ncbi:hypothetical protein AB1Y20_013125 [Prymnesium parvum]|uniref:Protein-tyrosine sulfotransferase n=1 Tax=Prymnesium parvum TaxID=97485 RepID=A0AB34IKR4_PRYPA